MALTVYHYDRCGTCRKARKWLSERGVAHTLVDITTAPPDVKTLKRALEAVGDVKKLFNTSGQSYREGGFKERLPSMTEDEALEALAADGKLVKRPLVLGKGVTLVGFKEDHYAAALA